MTQALDPTSPTIIEQLHDLASRGELLSPSEQTQLEAWYADLDRQEAQVLFGHQPAPSSSAEQEKLTWLQQQIDTLLRQLAETTARLQEVTKQNKRLRDEITLLRTKVAQSIVLEAA